MDFIDDWTDYIYDYEKYIREEDWDKLSLQYVSDCITEKYKDKLNWSIIVANWQINQSLYEKYKCQLEPYKDILKIRQKYGFININII